MEHMHHGRNSDEQVEPNAKRNRRVGLVLFGIYSAIYATFMLLNAFTPRVMEQQVLDGINLAVAYGLGLIVTAFVLALIYAWFCSTAKDREGSGS